MRVRCPLVAGQAGPAGGPGEVLMVVHAAGHAVTGSRRPARSDGDSTSTSRITWLETPDQVPPPRRITKLVAQGMQGCRSDGLELTLPAVSPEGLPAQDTGVPPPRPGAISRAGLVKTARSSGCRVVAVTAPAGYGKSIFLAQWAQTEDRRVAWVSLDRFDDDPATLLLSLASAYCQAGLGHADLVADMGGPGVSALPSAALRLASALYASPVPFVLMLDDLHTLQSPACHDVLSTLIVLFEADLGDRDAALSLAALCVRRHDPGAQRRRSTARPRAAQRGLSASAKHVKGMLQV